MRWLRRASCHLLILLPGLLLGAAPIDARGVGERLGELLSEIPAADVPSGVLYDRVLALSRIEDHDGTAASRPITAGGWRQLYHEIRGASLADHDWPAAGTLRERADAHRRRGVVPIAVLDARYSRIRSDALQTGALVARGARLVPGTGEAFTEGAVFAVAPLQGATHRGEEVVFRLDPALYFATGARTDRLEVDFDDGRGFVTVALDRDHSVRYPTSGRKAIRIRASFADGAVRYASAFFEVAGLVVPLPDDTLAITATIPYLGEFGSGEAYVYLADGHATITNPIIVVEGFDLDNTMNWDELYTLLNQENLLEDMRAIGFDAVVLNFNEAVDYIQRNGFMLVELIQQINAMIDPGVDIAVVGASMGGLVSRYALSYMESMSLPHNTRLFLSFDSPQNGAAIPLGIQYWLVFFEDDAAEAAQLLAALDSPAARQLLAYHHTTPPGPVGQSDSLYVALRSELAGLGDYPALPRTVAIANGSGSQIGQTFQPGEQIIEWEYRSILVDIDGNVWAVPDSAFTVIFDGLIDIILFPSEELTVGVDGTRPFDNAPGGWRNSMATMDATAAPYGDIIALHDNHCFIPTVSALAVDTEDLFYDLANDPDILSRTPFDAVYFPVTPNQEHVLITPENSVWVLAELQAGVTAVGPGAPGESVAGVALISAATPNPFRDEVLVSYRVPRTGRMRLAIYDAAGRRVVALADRVLAAGEHAIGWDGSNTAGRGVGAGTYFLRAETGGRTETRRITLVR